MNAPAYQSSHEKHNNNTSYSTISYVCIILMLILHICTHAYVTKLLVRENFFYKKNKSSFHIHAENCATIFLLRYMD